MVFNVDEWIQLLVEPYTIAKIVAISGNNIEVVFQDRHYTVTSDDIEKIWSDNNIRGFVYNYRKSPTKENLDKIVVALLLVYEVVSDDEMLNRANASEQLIENRN